ncbi:MAG: hypothetical protein JWN48_2197 [Myxococcaceae bacterium]|nr:hypothetical protein [Myxococcaceae bacterium]
MRALTVLLLAWSLTLGCGEDGAAHARRVIRETHAREVRAIVREDVARHLVGVAAAGARIAPGFATPDPKLRSSQMRTALRLLTKPPKGIPQLIVSARTFTAAVEPSGVVLATDAKPEIDRMTGVDLAKQFEVVRAALAGTTGFAIDQFPAVEQGAEGSVALLFAAASRKSGTPVGAVLTGIPLWRLAQRLTKQLQLDHVSEKGAILWVYLLRGDKLHHFGTPPDLDTMLPPADIRAAGLKQSPGGFTGEFLQFGRWYAWGVVPLPVLGPEIAALIVRADPA